MPGDKKGLGKEGRDEKYRKESCDQKDRSQQNPGQDGDRQQDCEEGHEKNIVWQGCIEKCSDQGHKNSRQRRACESSQQYGVFTQESDRSQTSAPEISRGRGQATGRETSRAIDTGIAIRKNLGQAAQDHPRTGAGEHARAA